MQLRFSEPSRDRISSFVAFSVDAERLRRDYFPKLLASKIRDVQGPTGFPPLAVSMVDDSGRVVYPPGGQRALTVVDEREFPLVFFDKELLAFAAPLETHRETWRLKTGYEQPIGDIIQARARPQRALMAMLAAIMALGVFFVARVAAREVRLAELKSNFVSSVSHDLKTPLALIQLFAETLELGRLKNTERAHEYYRIINSEARKLTRLINNILDFSRIEAGLRRYKSEPADLTALTRRTLESLESQFRQNQFTVTTRFAPDMPAVVLDEEAAEQALENLLSNAMKYSPEHRGDPRRGGPRRGVRPRARDRPRHRHPAAAAAADLPQVLPRRERRRIGPAGHRPRPGHRGPRHAGARRLRPGGQRARPRQHVHAPLPRLCRGTR